MYLFAACYKIWKINDPMREVVKAQVAFETDFDGRTSKLCMSSSLW